MKRGYPLIYVSAAAEETARAGHPWIYADEITRLDGSPEDGALVDVVTAKGRYLGTGFYNSVSKIRVRIISSNANDKFDKAFWHRRICYALDYRKTVMGADFNSCRLIFGEADGIPGMTCDKFENVLSVEIACLGTELIKETLYGLLLAELALRGEKIDAIYERNELALRGKEGLPCEKGFWYGSGDGHVIISENGIKYDVDYINGQKTGFFLDQKYNRLAAGKLACGKHVLDCFTHTGAFALNCAAMGAESVTAVDISEEALKSAKRNAALNRLENKINFVCNDVFDLLTEAEKSGGHPWDYIILDPPAFTKSSATVGKAIGGYREINKKAMRLLPRGGYLATCSCSHFMTDSLFRKMLKSAAAEANVTLKQIEARTQAPDHPIMWNVPETDYLKFYLFQIV